MTIACGNVIEAKNEKKSASKINMSFEIKYKTPIPNKEIIQYKKAVLKYFLKFTKLNSPNKKII